VNATIQLTRLGGGGGGVVFGHGWGGGGQGVKKVGRGRGGGEGGGKKKKGGSTPPNSAREEDAKGGQWGLDTTSDHLGSPDRPDAIGDEIETSYSEGSGRPGQSSRRLRRRAVEIGASTDTSSGYKLNVSRAEGTTERIHTVYPLKLPLLPYPS